MAGVTAARFQSTCTMVRTTWCLRVLGINPTSNQVRFVTLPSSPEAAKRGIEELKDKAASQSKEAVGATENIGEKAKQSAKEAWNATKDAAQKVQDTVAGKAEASVDIIKDNIEAAKHNINTKN